MFIIFDKLPYYNSDKEITKWERFSQHNAKKYAVLSTDNPDLLLHTPNKTLLCVIHLPDNEVLHTRHDYLAYYREHYKEMRYADISLDVEKGGTVIVNDYATFMDKI